MPSVNRIPAPIYVPTALEVRPSHDSRVLAAPRYAFLDGIRAVLALYVVLNHAWFTIYDYDREGTSRAFQFLGYGRYAVCFFIILSGFCLMLPALRNNLRCVNGVSYFVKRRALRILPPYYFALGFTLLLISTLIHDATGSHWDNSLPVTFRNVMTHLLLVHNFVPGDFYKINHVFWSIAVEWQIYFIFPLLLLCWRIVGGRITVVAALLAATLLEGVLRSHFHVGPRVNFIGLFALGMWTADFVMRSNAVNLLHWRLFAAFSFCVSLTLNHFHWPLTADVAFGCFASSFLVIVALNRPGWLCRVLSSSPLVAIGYFSYSLYLVHAPLLQLIWQYPLAGMHSQSNVSCLVLIFAGVPIVMVLSYVFYLCFERPFYLSRSLPTHAAPPWVNQTPGCEAM